MKAGRKCVIHESFIQIELCTILFKFSKKVKLSLLLLFQIIHSSAPKNHLITDEFLLTLILIHHFDVFLSDSTDSYIDWKLHS